MGMYRIADLLVQMDVSGRTLQQAKAYEVQSEQPADIVLECDVDEILELNPEHEAVKAMQSAMVGDTQKAKDYAKLLYCQAMLIAELPLEDPMGYTELVCKLMK